VHNPCMYCYPVAICKASYVGLAFCSQSIEFKMSEKLHQDFLQNPNGGGGCLSFRSTAAWQVVRVIF
jgi:hypothetical protein